MTPHGGSPDPSGRTAKTPADASYERQSGDALVRVDAVSLQAALGPRALPQAPGARGDAPENALVRRSGSDAVVVEAHEIAERLSSAPQVQLNVAVLVGRNTEDSPGRGQDRNSQGTNASGFSPLARGSLAQSSEVMQVDPLSVAGEIASNHVSAWGASRRRQALAAYGRQLEANEGSAPPLLSAVA